MKKYICFNSIIKYHIILLLNNNSPHKFNHNASRETDNISRDILTKANIKGVEFATGRKLNDGVTVCVYFCQTGVERRKYFNHLY